MKKKKEIKDFIIILMGRVFQALYLIIMMRVLTTFLSADQIGRINILNSIIALLTMIFLSPISSYFLRYVIQWENERKLLTRTIINIFLIFSISSLLALVLLAVHSLLGVGITIAAPTLFIIVCGNLLFSSLANNLAGTINILGDRRYYIFVINLASWLGLLLAILLVNRLGHKAELWMIGLILGQGVAILFAWVKLFKVVGHEKWSTDDLKNIELSRMFSFSLPFMISTCFYWIQTNGYRFFMLARTNEETIGNFYTGFNLALAPIMMFDTIFTEYYRPIFYREIEQERQSSGVLAWNQYARRYLPLVILVGCYVALMSPFLAEVLVSESFHTFSWLGRWGALTQTLLVITSLFVSLSFAVLGTKMLIVPNILGAVALILSLNFLPATDTYLRFAISLPVGMFTTMIALYFVMRRKFPIVIPVKECLFALLGALPLAILTRLLAPAGEQRVFFNSLLTLILAGFYLLGIMFIFIKRWIFFREMEQESYALHT